MELIEKIRAEIERLNNKMDNRDPLAPNQKAGYLFALADVLSFLDTLESETTYDTQQYTPRPSVDIEDVARVQFASHAKVFDKKRKAVFDWEQFKEVASIFYGFGKKDSLEESERPEPYNPVYDEAYLNEKIKKATESWKGVDVNKMLAECRGYDEPEVDLEKEIDKTVYECTDGYNFDWDKFARHFYNLGLQNAK